MKRFKKRISGIVLAIVMVLTMIPALPTMTVSADSNFTNQTITMHFKPASEWASVYAYIKQGSTWDTIPGYTYIADWPGAEVEKDSKNDGWYSFTITMPKNEVHCIFNNNDQVQTSNIEFTPDKETTEKWVTMSDNTMGSTVVSDTKPSGWIDSTSNAPVNPNASSTVKSPVVNTDRTITFNLDATGKYKDETDVRLMGTVPGTDWNDGLAMEKKGDVFTVTTRKVDPGIYQYKFRIDPTGKNDWQPDPANSEILDGNSKVVVPGLENKKLEVTAGEELTLPKLTLYLADGTTKEENVTYTLKEANSKVSLKDGKLSVEKNSGIKEIKLEAKAGNETSEVTVNVVEEQYTYNIYFYDQKFPERVNVGAADIWMWEDGGGNLPVGTFTEKVKLADGNEWLKAEVVTSAKSIGFIPRSVGAWTWQTENHYYNNADGKKTVDLYVVNGDKNTYTSLPEIKELRERYVVVEYDRPNNDYDGWNIYSWNSGFGSETEIYSQEINGKHYIIVPVKDADTDFTLSFCMRRSGTDQEDKWLEKDGGDHYVLVPADQNVVKVKFEQGKGVTETLPYNKGYEMKGNEDKISFYYRDDSLMTTDTEKSLDGKVKVVVNGKSHDMKYNAETERYEYDENNCKTGEYTYYYSVDGKDVIDSFNKNSKTVDGKEVSYFTYKKFDNLGITASVLNEKMDYNDNNVLSVEFSGDDKEQITNEEVSSIVADVSELGLDKLSVEPSLMKTTISVTDTTAIGNKTIPVVLTDIYGNTYETTVSVEVTKRDGDDFDWDEAVIYMTCTDRFFDGNTSNDKTFGKTDVYDKDGSLSYHGGDFAGLEQKLDYLDDLGVNTIWITPIVENSDTTTDKDGETIPSTGYHGYWASDFTKLNPHLGTEAEFKSLIDAVHAHGMKLMVDVVLNHAGYNTEDTFNSILKDKDGNTINMIRDDSNTVTGDDVYASLSGLPDFVTENEDVMNQLVEWQTEWVENYDIDYYRVDTVKHVNSETWAAFKNALTAANADFKMIGEYAGAGYGNTAGELSTGRMDSLLDFDYNDQAENFVSGDLESVESFLENRNASINNTATLGAFLSSHDEDSLIDKLRSEKNMTEEEALNAAKVAASLQLTSKGQMVIYYGEEIGQHGLNNYPDQTNRYDFDWDELENQKTDEGSMYNHYKKLLAIREEYSKLLSKGTRTNVMTSNEEGYSVFERSYGGKSLTVALNVKDDAKEVTIPVGLKEGAEIKDLYSGNTYTVNKDQSVVVTIPAAKDGGTVILAETKKSENIEPDNGKNDDSNKKSDKTGTDVKNNTPVSKDTQKTVKKSATKTGDENDFVIYICLMGFAAAAIGAGAYRKKRACK